MHDDKHAQAAAQAKENEALLVVGVIGVADQASPLICEDALRLLEGHTMLLQVRTRLHGIPLEAQRGRMHIVCTSPDVRNEWADAHLRGPTSL